jgi:alpha-L-rhamnosidase
MLLQTGMPSWLYQVTMGASTMWERLDGLFPDGKVHSERPSFSHYSFGSVAGWMHKYIGGLSLLEPA